MKNSYLLEHKYFFLLISLVAIILACPLYIYNNYFNWCMHSILAILLIYICFHISQKFWILFLITILGLTSSAGALFVIFNANETAFLLRYTLMLIFYFCVIIILLGNITQPKMVTKDILLGSLCVYILIGMLFGSIYLHIEYYYPHSFDLSNININSNQDIIVNFAYFSFTTLSTVGFGDIVPLSIMAKSIVIIEEISGIFYLAILVSRLAVASS
ncbi:MAG: ion channel [Candidatus Berkiella sp.]